MVLADVLVQRISSGTWSWPGSVEICGCIYLGTSVEDSILNLPSSKPEDISVFQSNSWYWYFYTCLDSATRSHQTLSWMMWRTVNNVRTGGLFSIQEQWDVICMKRAANPRRICIWGLDLAAQACEMMNILRIWDQCDHVIKRHSSVRSIPTEPRPCITGNFGYESH